MFNQPVISEAEFVSNVFAMNGGRAVKHDKFARLAFDEPSHPVDGDAGWFYIEPEARRVKYQPPEVPSCS